MIKIDWFWGVFGKLLLFSEQNDHGGWFHKAIFDDSGGFGAVDAFVMSVVSLGSLYWDIFEDILCQTSESHQKYIETHWSIKDIHRDAQKYHWLSLTIIETHKSISIESLNMMKVSIDYSSNTDLNMTKVFY